MLPDSPPVAETPKSSADVLYQRQLDGCLGRVPSTFYESVYHILERAPCGVLIMSNLLPQVRELLRLPVEVFFLLMSQPSKQRSHLSFVHSND